MQRIHYAIQVKQVAHLCEPRNPLAIKFADLIGSTYFEQKHIDKLEDIGFDIERVE